MSICLCIKDILTRDYIDGNATTVSTRNSNLWSSPSLVPFYAYKSLASLWTSTNSSSILSTRINYQFGESLTSPEGEIALFATPMESVRVEEPLMSNTTGAETVFLDIVLDQPQGEMSTVRMEQVELRIRYLLDYKWRSARRGGGIVPTSPVVRSTADPTISGDILCLWHSYLTPLKATEMGVRYVVAYQRNVPV